MSKNIMIIWGSLVVMICGMLVILGLNLEDNKIERELEGHKVQMMKDIAIFDQMYEKNIDFCHCSYTFFLSFVC